MNRQLLQSLKAYDELLRKHDYAYEFSDDRLRVNEGKEQSAELEFLAMSSPLHAKLLKRYQARWSNAYNVGARAALTRFRNQLGLKPIQRKST